MPSILLIAYGNISRRDDGVALHIVRKLRARLGLPPEPEGEEEYTELRENLALACVHQLAPELVQVLAEHDAVVFIDAHVASPDWEPVQWQEVKPAYKASLVTHHLKPDALLALCGSLYDRCPRGYILSVLGVDFDFGEDLAPETEALAEEAAARLQTWIDSGGNARF